MCTPRPTCGAGCGSSCRSRRASGPGAKRAGGRGRRGAIMSVEAIKRAGDNPTGESVKKAFESMKDFDTWGITPPFTYTNEDHRPTNRGRLVQIKGGKVVQLKEVSVDRDMKWIGK